MKTKFSALTLALLLTAVSMPAFAGAAHDHDREPPRQKNSDQRVMNNKKDGRDIGSIPSSGKNQLPTQRIEPSPKKNESKPESESETSQRRPPHHTGMRGL